MSEKRTFLTDFPKALSDDAAALFIGAGVSMAAGYPSWRELLKEIGEELGVRSSDVGDLAALAQWSIRKSSGRTRILKVIREQIGILKPVPPALRVVTRLPVRTLWTTNYDRLIERAFEEAGRPIDAVSSQADLAIRNRTGAVRLYKMHGTVERLDDLVIATDDYELYRQRRGGFLPLLQAHLTGFSMLFVGLSFADPNLRHVLSLIRESFTDAPPDHYAIVKPPHRSEFDTADEFHARRTQHKWWSDDLLRYGLHVVEIDDYDEIPALLQSVERASARDRVWISGSWPTQDSVAPDIANFCMALGRSLGYGGMSLVTGSGLTVGSGVTTGFLEALQRTGSWDLERRLIVRPFAQPIGTEEPNRQQWLRLRDDMARISGAVVFVGGAKVVDGGLADAEGVLEEFSCAEGAGSFLIPVGYYGGAARTLARRLIGSALSSTGADAQRPTDNELRQLDAAADVQLVESILRRARKA